MGIENVKFFGRPRHHFAHLDYKWINHTSLSILNIIDMSSGLVGFLNLWVCSCFDFLVVWVLLSWVCASDVLMIVLEFVCLQGVEAGFLS